MKARLALNPRDLTSHYALASAFAHLNEFDKAKSELRKIEALRPEQFRTAFLESWICVQENDLPAALNAAEKAIALRPAGHDDMGDYFVRMLRWQLERQNNSALPVNFLGIGYGGGAEALAASPILNQPYLVGLIKHFPEFADGYLTLGDWFSSKDSNQLAIRCYLKGRQISAGSDTQNWFDQRISTLETEWRAKAESSEDYVFDPEYRTRLELEFKAAADWRLQYEQCEQELVQKLFLPAEIPSTSEVETPLPPGNEVTAAVKLPERKQVEQLMKLRKLEGPPYYHVGLVAAKPAPWKLITQASPYLWTLAGFALFGFWLLYRRTRSDKKKQRYQL